MDEDAIRAFCQAWMGHFHQEQEAKERGTHLADAILQHGHPGVRALAGNPLLLTLLAQVYRESGDRALPHRRVDLFDETLHVLYKRREHLWDSKNITELRLARSLSAVAYHLHSQESAGFTTRGSVSAWLGYGAHRR
jgi:predicted NACHT family NTPase